MSYGFATVIDRPFTFRDVETATWETLCDLLGLEEAFQPRIRLLAGFRGSRGLTDEELDDTDGNVVLWWTTPDYVEVSFGDAYFHARMPSGSMLSFVLMFAATIAAARLTGSVVETNESMVPALDRDGRRFPEYTVDELMGALRVSPRPATLEEAGLAFLSGTAFANEAWSAEELPHVGLRLFTPLSPEEAASATSGLGFPDGVLYFDDLPDLEEAEEDAVWVWIDVPETDVAGYEVERPPNSGTGNGRSRRRLRRGSPYISPT